MGTFSTTVDPETKLWVAKRAEQAATEIRDASFRRGLLKRRRKPITIYGPHGKPVGEIRVHEQTGSTEHEYIDHQDAVARPLPAVPRWAMKARLF